MNKEGAALQQVADIFVCHLVSSFGDLIAPQHHVPIRAPGTGRQIRSHDLAMHGTGDMSHSVFSNNLVPEHLEQGSHIHPA